MSFQPTPSASGFLPSTGFVGRQREIMALRSLLEKTLSGQGQLVLLAGEPGIGKTRTAQEVAAYAETQGAQVLWGRCYDEEGAPPYWPWVQVIRSCLQHWQGEKLATVMGPGVADIAEFVPQVRDRLTDLQPPPALEPEQARFRLFESISTFLKNCAQSQPLVLVLDDLHWADRSSLLMLAFLAREMGASPLLVAAIYRNMEVSRQHPLSDTLAQLAREPVLQRVQLRGLNREDTESFFEMMAGFRPTRRLAETIYTHTEGNPFFMTEVIRSLLEQGGLAPDATDEPVIIRMPEGVREVVGVRLNRLSEQCHQALTTAATIGRQFDFKLLHALDPGTAEEQLLGVMDEALSAHLVEELPGLTQGYQFSHSLVQEALASELSAARRVRLHARIGEALEKLYGNEAESHAPELAFHFAQAQPVLGPERSVHYSLLAGERAAASYAYEEALTYFQRGLLAKGIALTGTDPAQDPETAAMLFGLARAQSATRGEDQLLETFALLKRAFDYYAGEKDIALAVAAAGFPIDNTGRAPGSAELMVRALALVPDGSHEAGRLLSRYGGILGLALCDYQGAQQALEKALSIARREGDVALEVQTMTYGADVSGQHLHWQESVKDGLRAISLTTGHESNYSAVLSRWWTSVSLLHLGDLERARPPALFLRDFSAKQSTPRYFSIFSLVPIVTLSCLEGDWKAGREYCNRVLKRAPTFRQIQCARVLLEYETGEFHQGKIYLERLVEVLHRGLTPFALGKAPMTLMAVARITGLADHLDMVESTAAALLAKPLVPPIVAMYARAGLALLAVHTNNQSKAAEHYAYFCGHQGTMIWSLISVDRLLGLLSQTAGNLNLSGDHFEAALTFCRDAGYQPELAWTCYDYVGTLLQRDHPGDREKAVSLLNEALTISQQMGMRPLMERVIALRERTESQPAKSPPYPDGLTQREIEVLRLVAVGKGDREIAEILVIAESTVRRHVSNIYTKISANNRAEATRYALRVDLVSIDSADF